MLLNPERLCVRLLLYRQELGQCSHSSRTVSCMQTDDTGRLTLQFSNTDAAGALRPASRSVRLARNSNAATLMSRHDLLSFNRGWKAGVLSDGEMSVCSILNTRVNR